MGPRKFSEGLVEKPEFCNGFVSNSSSRNGDELERESLGSSDVQGKTRNFLCHEATQALNDSRGRARARSFRARTEFRVESRVGTWAVE